jgi:hypothetical protein
LPPAPEPTGVVPRVRAGVVEAQRALSRLRFAPAVVIGALLGSAPYLVQEHARARVAEPPRITAHELPRASLETSQLAAAAAPVSQVAPTPQPPPSAIDEVDLADIPELQSRPKHNTIERAHLLRARKLLREGDGFGAQLVLARLAERAPHGRLTRQRKLLEIQVLQVIGGKAAAQRAANDFAKAYPRSPQLTKLSGLLL